MFGDGGDVTAVLKGAVKPVARTSTPGWSIAAVVVGLREGWRLVGRAARSSGLVGWRMAMGEVLLPFLGSGGGIARWRLGGNGRTGSLQWRRGSGVLWVLFEWPCLEEWTRLPHKAGLFLPQTVSFVERGGHRSSWFMDLALHFDEAALASRREGYGEGPGVGKLGFILCRSVGGEMRDWYLGRGRVLVA